MTTDYTLQEKDIGLGVCMIELYRNGVFERRATGADRESAIRSLKRQCAFAADEGRRAQEVLDWLKGQGPG